MKRQERQLKTSGDLHRNGRKHSIDDPRHVKCMRTPRENV